MNEAAITMAPIVRVDGLMALKDGHIVVVFGTHQMVTTRKTFKTDDRVALICVGRKLPVYLIEEFTLQEYVDPSRIVIEQKLSGVTSNAIFLQVSDVLQQAIATKRLYVGICDVGSDVGEVLGIVPCDTNKGGISGIPQN